MKELRWIPSFMVNISLNWFWRGRTWVVDSRNIAEFTTFREDASFRPFEGCDVSRWLFRRYNGTLTGRL